VFFSWGTADTSACGETPSDRWACM